MGISKKIFYTSVDLLRNPLKKSFLRIEPYSKVTALPNEIENTYQPIEKYYAGKSLFVTGATGFLGKVFMEKLLYSCPSIDNIFILIRKKDKLDTADRIKQLIELPIFQRVRNEKPQNLKKIVPISGDIISPELGISEEDSHILTEKVSHVIHFAANVKSDDPLECAMKYNVEGTRKVLNLCKRLKNIEVSDTRLWFFVHVSTAYSNTNLKVVEENVYPSPASIDDINKMMEQNSINEKQTKQLLGERPNTYTFTKALAESLVKEQHGNIPTIIVRPSIVSASIRDPMMGWVDNWGGSTGLIATAAKGVNRILIGDRSNILDLIPVDYVSNLIIAAAAKSRPKEVAVYNCCTSAVNPITLGELSTLILEDSVKHNFSEIMKPKLRFTQSKWLFKIVTTSSQKMPAIVADCYLRLLGKKPRYIKIQKQLSKMARALEYFTYHSWQFKSQRTRDLYASLSESDRHQFPFDPATIDWKKYIPIYCMGIRKYLFKKS